MIARCTAVILARVRRHRSAGGAPRPLPTLAIAGLRLRIPG